MAYFTYQGRDRVGKQAKGRVKADSKKEAIEQLKGQGVSISGIKELDSVFYQDIQIGSGVKPKDFVIYLRQFATLIKAGIPLVQTTYILAEQTNSKALKHALNDIGANLESGKAFSDAAANHPKVFSNLFVNMFRAGEAGGKLEEILERLASYYEKQYDTRQKVISALTYPVIVGVIALVIVCFLLAFVVPRFASMFDSLGGELPFITQMTLELSGFVQSFWYIVMLIPVALLVVFKLVSKEEKFQHTFDQVKLKIPVFGGLIQKAALVRMMSTLSSLLNSSVPILQSLHITEKVVENKVVEKAIKDSYSSLERGDSLSDPLSKHKIFPPLVIQMVAVGEKTGSLDYMLERVASFYESELEYTTERLKTLIEPLMILFLAILVGGIVAAIAIPMFSIFDSVQ
ncbi:type II secretion system F family protein [Thalassobacillus hwangdonensis]|uniref:Type II secretion system F family protein n=1 Tax=Thalassobacillus hwangdonensis TaxID=546108 RepID=A0ABW3KYF3_9BACI